jgi:alpha-beta hydrolase superfamily lysophospholipase
MGGNLVLNYILRRTPEIKGLITSSPFLRLAFKPPKWKITLGELMLKIWPSLTLPSELEEKAISRVDAEVKRYKKDPLIHDKISPMFTFPVMEAGEWAITNGNTVRIPVLVLHGTGDRIIDHKASMEFANTSKMVEIKMFENGYHELHHDLCHEEFMKTIINWLENQKKSSS